MYKPKYLTREFVVYRDPKLNPRSEMQAGGVVQREGFKYGSFANPVKSADGTYKVRIGTGEILQFNTKAEVIAEGKRREKLRRENMKTGVAKQEEGRLKIRNDVDDWTREWIEDNIDKYEFGQRDKFLNDIKKAWKTKSKDFKATRKLSLSAADYPRVTDNINFDNSFSMYGQDITQTQVKNEKEFFDSLFTRIFYKNKFETDPTLRANGQSYLKYINANKRNLTRYKTPDELKEIFGTFDDPRIVEIFSKESDLTNHGKSQLFGSLFGDEYKKYQVKKQKMRDNYLNNVDIIKKKTGIDVRKELQKEQQFLKKLFKVDKLPEELRYGGDHMFGISEIAKMTDKKEMKNAVNSMVGLLHQENFNLGVGMFEDQRGELVKKVNSAKGPAKSAALSELNDLMRSTYGQYFPNQKNFYSLSNNKLIVDPNFKGQTQPQRMANWAYKVSKKDPELIKTTFTDKTVQKAFLDLRKGSSKNMINLIQSQFKDNPQLFQVAEASFGGGCRVKKSAGGRIPGEDYNACIARNFNETVGDVTSTDDAKRAKATTKLMQMGRGAAKLGKGALKGLQAALIGTGPGEIAATVVLEAAAPIYNYFEGEELERVFASAPILGFALSKIDPENFSDEALEKIVYGQGLTDEEMIDAEIVANQLRRYKKMTDLFRQRASLLEYEDQLISEGAQPGIVDDKIEEIDKQVAAEAAQFAKEGNEVTKERIMSFDKGIQNYAEETQFQKEKRFINKYLTNPAASPLTPVDIRDRKKASLIGEFFGDLSPVDGPLYQIGQNLTPELRTIATPEVKDYYNFAEGGIVERKGFANGPKITRRGFIGAAAALIASLKLGSFGQTGKKVTTEVGKRVIKNAPKGTPDWFAPLVDKVFKEGVDAGETMKTVTSRETVKKLEVKNPETNTTESYFLYENPDTGEVRIDIDAPFLGANDGEFSLYMRPDRVDGVSDDGAPILEEGEFFVTEERAVGRSNGPDDFDIELETIDTDLSGSASDYHRVEEFATGKTDKKAQAEQLKKKDYIEKNPGDDIESRYGPYDDTPPDDYYD